MSDSMFIGLVTHPKTRFPEASGPAGLAELLAQELASLGWSAQSSVMSENLIDSSILTLTHSNISDAVRLEMKIEQDWNEFQHRKVDATKRHIWLRIREIFRLAKLQIPTASARESARRQMVRLANIEMAHLMLLQEGEESGADWILILEDDAINSDVPRLSRELDRHLRLWGGQPQPFYVNLSRSFSLDRLKHGGSLTREGPWSQDSHILSSTIPFTNTVCAVLYRKEFLQALNRELKSIPLEPVVPIDWKINMALMNLSGKGLLGKGDCYTIDPAPILQGSMLKADHST